MIDLIMSKIFTFFIFFIGLLCFNGYGYINDFVSNYNSSYIQSGVFFIILYFISSIISIPFSNAGAINKSAEIY